MKNRYAQKCSICQVPVPSGEGTMKLVRNKWLVVHEDSCPRHPSTNSLARTKAVRIARILADPETEKIVVFEAVELLGLLVKTEWLDLERCKRSILSCGSTRNMDRVEVEEVVDHFLRSASS
jgi:hypothetical protein